ncbi:MAG: hypothetical protein WCQ55_06395, partial [Paludibacteraceae bacterium]
MKLILKVAIGIFAFLLPIHASGQGTDLVLVSATDFSVSGGEDDYYHSTDMIDGYTGVIKPNITIGGSFTLVDTTGSNATESSFLDSQHYAVTPNPIRLDSLRMYDNADSGEWGLVFSGGKKGLSGNTVAMTYTVNGLKNNAEYQVEIEWCNPLSATYLNPSGSNPDPHLTGGYQSQIKVGTNNTQIDGTNAGSPGTTAGVCKTQIISSPSSTTTTQGPIVGGKLEVNVIINQMGAGEAIMIKSIKVYSKVDVAISGLQEVCLGGESSVLSLTASYVDSKYQWYRDGVAIAGATGQTYKHESSLTASSTSDGSKTYQYTVKVTAANGDVIESDPFEMKDVLCCGSVENPSSRKLIWQDDFGTFTSTGNYWIWDYTDIDEPKKVSKTTADGWTYGLDYSIPGASYLSTVAGEGTYSVAANVTCVWDNNPTAGGTQWEWQATAMNGLHPAENGWVFVPDHTYDGSAYGAMLFLNCGNQPNETIYDREITGLCQKKVTVKCFIGNFSASDYPVKVYIKATDVASGVSEVSQTVTRYSMEKFGTPSGQGWQEVSVDIELTTATPVLKFEIISEAGGADQNKLGNDLILDDIQVYACAAPSVQMYFDDQTFALDTASCEGEDVSLFVDKTKMIENYYGDDARYIYQWTANPEDKKSWKSVLPAVTDKTFVNDMSEIFANFLPDDKIYFRVVLATDDIFASYGGVTGYYNPDEACSSYTVSDTIVAKVSCPSCTEPKDPKIKATGGVVSATKKRVDLCSGESTVLTTNDITGIDKSGAAYSDYTISWYKETTASSALSPNTSAVTADPLTVAYADATELGTKYIVRVHDNFENATGTKTCDKFDTILVVANPKPDKTLTVPEAFCEGKLKTEPNKEITGYDILWYAGPDTVTGADEPTVTSVKAENSPMTLYYVLKDKTTGCRGEANEYEIKVNAIPEETLAAIADFCEGDATAKLPDSEKGYKVKWYKEDKSTEAEETLANLAGSTTPYTYYYTLMDASEPTNCTSEPAKYEFTVKPKAKVTIEVAYDCDMTTLTAKTEPSVDVTATWTLAAGKSTDNPLILDGITNGAGAYSVVATADGYCDSEPAEETVKFHTTPDAIKFTVSEYLKMDGTPDYAKIDAAAAAAKMADGEVTVYWSAPQGPTSLDESATQSAPASGYTDTRANPTPNMGSMDDEFFYYWVYQERKNGDVTCQGDTNLVVVPILGAPSPIVHDTTYCVNSTVAAAIGENVKINQAKANKTYELVWYDGVDANTAPDVTTAGTTTYSVAQRETGTTNESAKRSFTITVIGVDKPNVADNTLAYCAGASATAVVAKKVDDNSKYLYADAFVWSEGGGAESAAAPTPDTEVTATTTYEYSVYQTYKIPATGEVCKGDPSTFEVKVTYVPVLKTESVLYLKSDAENGTFAKNIKQQNPSVYGGEEAGATLNWYESDCTTPITGTPTPTVDPTMPEGTDQTVTYCVSQTVDGCESGREKVEVTISDSPVPTGNDVIYC